MFFSCSGEQNEQSESPFEFLAQLEFEKVLKITLMAILVKKMKKSIKVQVGTRKTYFYQIKSTFQWFMMALDTFWVVVQKIYFLHPPYCKVLFIW